MAYGLCLVSQILVRDAKGASGIISFNHPLNTDIGALKNTVRSTAALIDAIIGCQVVDASIGIEASLTGATLKDAPIAGADVEEGARFMWRTASGALTDFRIPTFSETYLTDSGELVYVEDDEVDDFIQRVLAGVTSGLTNVSPSDAYGSDITEFVSGAESFLASRG